MCWWQFEDVGDGFCHFRHQHPLSFYLSVGHQHSKDVTKIQIQSPTSLSPDYKQYCINHIRFEPWLKRGQKVIGSPNLGPWTTLVMTSMPSEYHDLLIFGFYNWFQDIVIELFWGSWKVNLTEVVWFIAMRSFNWIYFRKINLSSRSARKKDDIIEYIEL